jgi:hypothetical protein
MQFCLSLLPVKEYWMGFVFNGAKIGFSRFEVTTSEESNRFDIRSEAYFRIRFLMLDKTIRLQSYDRVNADLTLVHFAYEYDLDGNRISLTGQSTADTLDIRMGSRGETSTFSIPLENPKIYPASVIGLYPLVHGLSIGRHHTYWALDGQTRRVAQVRQRVLAYEESDLFRGPAFKVETQFQNQTVTTWIDDQGRPLLEMSLGGVIIAFLEDRTTAQSYLTLAAFNKDETLLNFSLIPTARQIAAPERLRRLTLAIDGVPDGLVLPSDNRQFCAHRNDRVTCRMDIDSAPSDEFPADDDAAVQPGDLLPTYSITAHHPKIRRLAEEISAPGQSDRERIQLLIDWIQDHIERKAVDVFTALDVLEGRAAECQGHALLYAALARSIDLPSRVVNGIVYAEDFQGFLYHTWNESHLGGKWIAVDPTFDQIPADATHVKFLDGSEMADLLPLAALIGKIKVKILSLE